MLRTFLPIIVMIFAPGFFATNLIFGRFVAGNIDPFILGFLRWALVAFILLPFALMASDKKTIAETIKKNWLFLIFVGFLGMGISGSGVYFGLQYTTATNATLIYSTAPILIILLEWAFSKRQSSLREVIGIALAFIGVAVIVLRGDLVHLATMNFNLGDLMIALAALSWAGYSIFYRSKRMEKLSNVVLFAVIACFGALVNLPLAVISFAHNSVLPSSSETFYAIGGIIFISSIIAFSAYQYGVRALGASVAGLFMYLMTPYGVVMAVVFLGEKLQPFHVIGIICVMVGVSTATFPKFVIERIRKLIN